MFTRLLRSSLRLSIPETSSRFYSTGTGAHNDEIIALLNRCIQEEEASPTRNGYKIRSFLSAITAIRSYPRPIRSGQEAMKLKGIGFGIADRIDLHLSGKQYDQSHEIAARAQEKLIAQMQTIPGVGERTATALVKAGANSLADLRKPQYQSYLTSAQRIGMQYAVHVERPIPRVEAEAIRDFIRDHISSKYDVEIVGSYRLGAPHLSEVELLFTNPSYVHVPTPHRSSPDIKSKTSLGSGALPLPFRVSNPTAQQRAESPFVKEIVQPLMHTGLLAASLRPGPYKWQGMSLLPSRDGEAWSEAGDRLRDLRAARGTYMRLDLNLAPIKSRGAALLALTGDADFIRSARVAASRLGMHLNEYGLWRFHHYDDPEALANTVAGGHWELVCGESEEGILEELDLGWIEPERRNFRFLSGKPSLSRKRQPRMVLNRAVLQELGGAVGPWSEDFQEEAKIRGRPRKEPKDGEEGKKGVAKRARSRKTPEVKDPEEATDHLTEK
ncbi:Nucleotidyltransferase [Artomyces pyxidatus]|uniref:Nucleotidyltransferase n=1 Tax=Artomyces pyxidatus TaxID=48021 RepID=A0ACB8T602_9AGAM|nr:Nucleotidyltransferase [Artomyces pyxidatus]